MLVHQMTIPDSIRQQAARSRLIFQIWMHSKYSNRQLRASKNLPVPIYSKFSGKSCRLLGQVHLHICNWLRGHQRRKLELRPQLSVTRRGHTCCATTSKREVRQKTNKILDKLEISRRPFTFCTKLANSFLFFQLRSRRKLQMPALGK